MTSKRELFHSLKILGFALLIALIFTLIIYIFFAHATHMLLPYYSIPICVPSVAFVFERVENRREMLPIQWVIDSFVITLSLARIFIEIPIISGHALFLTYGLMTMRSCVARGTAAVVMLEVIYLKLFVWHDFTLFGGILVGVVANIGFRRVNLKNFKTL